MFSLNRGVLRVVFPNLVTSILVQLNSYLIQINVLHIQAIQALSNKLHQDSYNRLKKQQNLSCQTSQW